jgi:hypothetical protein
MMRIAAPKFGDDPHHLQAHGGSSGCIWDDTMNPSTSFISAQWPSAQSIAQSADESHI